MTRELGALSKVHRMDSLDRGPAKGPFLVTEKVDGSQFSFGVFDGVLMARSKGRMIDLDAPQKLFSYACAHLKTVQHKMVLDWIYRGEVLQSQRHNKLRYDRVPKGHIALFGVSPEPHQWVKYEAVVEAAELLGVDVVPVLDRVDDVPDFDQYLELDSFLGGCKLEGVVLWPLDLEGAQLIKFVSPAFQETKVREPKKGKGMLSDIVDYFRTEARWDKTIQHLRDDGRLTSTDKDIGPLMKELHQDFDSECETEAKDLLWKLYGKQIKQSIAKGFVEHYRAWVLAGRESDDD